MWTWVPTIEVTRSKGSQRFLLKGIFIWNIHDYLAYGLFAGCQIKGYMTCPLCGPNVDTRWSSHLKKNVYLGQRHYLVRHHPYRKNRVNFNGLVEHRRAPIWMPLSDFPRRVKEKEEWLNRRKCDQQGTKMIMFMYVVWRRKTYSFYHTHK